MPTILTYVDKSVLGIVMTIDSFVTWLYLADVGIGNGLKNKLTEAIAHGDDVRAKSLVSTAYFSMFSILTLVFVVSSIVAAQLNWNSILKVDVDHRQLQWSVQFVLFAMLYSFGLRMINSILQAHQMAFVNSVSDLLIKVFKLVAVFLAIQFTIPSLFKFVFISHSVPLLVILALSIVLFRGNFSKYSPSLGHFSMGSVKEITSLGLKFFWVQIAAMILFSTDNVIITRLFTTGDVAVYNIIRHYYSQVWVIYTFISVPLWTAYTKAYAREDFDWIKRITRKVFSVSVLLSLAVIIMFIIYQPVIKFWLRGKIEVPVLLSVCMALSQIVMLLVSPFVSFVNGAGKLKLSMILSPIIILLNIPLSILFAKPLGMGVAGVVFATVVCNGLSLFTSTLHYYKLVYTKAGGIWSK